MGSFNEAALNAYQALVDAQADHDAAVERLAQTTRHELELAMAAGLVGTSDTVIRPVPDSCGRMVRTQDQAVADAINDVRFCKTVEPLFGELEHSGCPLVMASLLLNETSGSVAQCVDAELAMFKHSTCPRVIALRVAMAAAYAEVHAEDLAEAYLALERGVL